MKKLLPLFTLLASSVVLLFASGCVQSYDSKYVRGYRYVANHPEVGSPAWVKWVDDRVDTRYANNRRAEPATQEWYAVVDFYVLRSFDWDYYPTDRYRYHTYTGGTYDRTGDRTNYGSGRGVSDGGLYDGERGYPDYRYRIGDERSYRSDYRRDYRTDYRTRSNYGSSGYASNGRWVQGYRPGYRTDGGSRPGYYRGDYSSADTRDRYYGPARFGDRDDGGSRKYRSNLQLGSLKWKWAVTEALLSGRVPKPPPRSDPWDSQLAPTH